MINLWPLRGLILKYTYVKNHLNITGLIKVASSKTVEYKVLLIPVKDR